LFFYALALSSDNEDVDDEKAGKPALRPRRVGLSKSAKKPSSQNEATSAGPERFSLKAFFPINTLKQKEIIENKLESDPKFCVAVVSRDTFKLLKTRSKLIITFYSIERSTGKKMQLWTKKIYKSMHGGMRW